MIRAYGGPRKNCGGEMCSRFTLRADPASVPANPPKTPAARWAQPADIVWRRNEKVDRVACKMKRRPQNLRQQQDA
eukprot:6020123-Pyramimonas_sp.AAC.1